MIKAILKFGIIGTLTFLCLFAFFYIRSGKFRMSLIAAFASLGFYFGVPQEPAQAAKADALQPYQQTIRTLRRQGGLFGGKSVQDGSNPGQPDGGGAPDDGDDSESESIPKIP